MKKFFAFAFVAVAVAFASCAGNNEQNAQDSTGKDSTIVETVVSTVDSAAGVAGAAIDSAASAAKAAVDSIAK